MQQTEAQDIYPDGSTTVFGAELRAIGSANVYGNFGAVGDGSRCFILSYTT